MFTKKFSAKKHDLIILDPFPVGYKVGIWKELNSRFKIDFKVIFLHYYVFKDHYDKGFNVIRKYDKSLLNGFESKRYKNLFRLLYSIKDSKIIMLHGYNLYQNWIVLFFSKIVKTKIIWRGESNLRGIEEKNILKQKIKKYLLNFFFKNCHALLYSCNANKDFLKFYGVNKNKLFFTPCAVDNKFFQSQNLKISNSKNLSRNILGIDEDDLVILFVARFTKRKRPLDVLKALKKINNSKISVIFIGDGPEKKNMKIFAIENNIKVNFTGFINHVEMIRFYILADLKVVLSEYDPSPKVLNEAMNFSLPVIVTNNVGTSSDLVKNGKNGYIVEVGNIKDISKKIKFFNENRKMIKKMGAYSLKIINNWNFDYDTKGIMKAIKYLKI
jgi:glycosyltransferase involved in cell wall biosynthesis